MIKVMKNKISFHLSGVKQVVITGITCMPALIHGLEILLSPPFQVQSFRKSLKNQNPVWYWVPVKMPPEYNELQTAR